MQDVKSIQTRLSLLHAYSNIARIHHEICTTNCFQTKKGVMKDGEEDGEKIWEVRTRIKEEERRKRIGRRGEEE